MIEYIIGLIGVSLISLVCYIHMKIIWGLITMTRNIKFLITYFDKMEKKKDKDIKNDTSYQ